MKTGPQDYALEKNLELSKTGILHHLPQLHTRPSCETMLKSATEWAKVCLFAFFFFFSIEIPKCYFLCFVYCCSFRLALDFQPTLRSSRRVSGSGLLLFYLRLSCSEKKAPKAAWQRSGDWCNLIFITLWNWCIFGQFGFSVTLKWSSSEIRLARFDLANANLKSRRFWSWFWSLLSTDYYFFFQLPVCSAIFKSFKTEVQVKIPQLVFLPDGSHFKKLRL